MKLKGKEIGIIIILFGVLIVLGTYSFYFKDNRDKVKEIVAQEDTLQKDVDRLKNLESRADQIQAQINSNQSKLNKLMNLFPAEVRYEDGILFLNDITEHNDVKITGYTITESTPEPSVDANGKLVQNAATTEDNIASQTVGSGYTLSTGNVQYDFETDYDNLKKMIRYIYGYGSKRKGLNTITINKDDSGKLTGTASVDMYALTDGNREYTPDKNDGVKTGDIGNVFGK